MTAEALTKPQLFSKRVEKAKRIVDIGFEFSSCIKVKANKNSFQTANPTINPAVKKTGPKHPE